MKCPSCGYENESGVQFCGNCGTKLAETAKGLGKKLFCSNCGQENPPGSRFCQDCGSEIGKPVVTTQPVTPPHFQPVPIKTRTASWAWLLVGFAVVAAAVSLVYFLKLQPARAPTNEVGPTTRETAVPQAAGTCTSGEKLLYNEDFQDGTADRWPGIAQNAPLFSIAPAPDDADNLVLTVQKPQAASGQVQGGPQLKMAPFSNAVLRMRFYIAGPLPEDNNNWFSFNWLFAPQPFTLESQQVYDSRYQFPMGFNYFEMRRLQQPLTNVSVDRSASHPVSGKWYSLEIATYQPRTEVRLDGEQVMEYEDPTPLPPGTFGLEAWLSDPQVKLLFDDIAICELTAPE